MTMSETKEQKEKMVTVRMNTILAGPVYRCQPGKQIALPEDMANQLIDGGYAHLVKSSPKVETATAAPLDDRAAETAEQTPDESSGGDGDGLTAAAPQGDVKASPEALALAEKLGLDIENISGTGAGGAVKVDDVKAAAAAAKSASAQ